MSLPDEDVATLDDYARSQGLKSRSAALQRAIRMLRNRGLEKDYAAAWEEREASDEQVAWEAASADGLGAAAR